MSVYLVTGGAGFIGSNLCRAIVAHGDVCRVLDNFATGRRENLADISDRIELVEGSLTDLPTVRRAVGGVDFVLHQAALPSVPRSVKDPIASNDANVTGTVNVLVASRDAGVKRVVAASSSSVYGDSPRLPKEESMPTLPLSPYAVSKLAAERYCLAFHTVYGQEAVALRYFNVFGPRQDPKSTYAAVVPLFITRCVTGERIVIDGDGEQSRDFTYVDNVVEANLLSCTAEGAPGRVFNVACGERTTINELLRIAADATGGEPNFEHGPARTGDVKHSLADVTAAREVLGYTGAVGVSEGMKRTAEWYKQHPSG